MPQIELKSLDERGHRRVRRFIGVTFLLCLSFGLGLLATGVSDFGPIWNPTEALEAAQSMLGLCFSIAFSFLLFPGLWALLMDFEVRLARRLDPKGTGSTAFCFFLALLGMGVLGFAAVLLTRLTYLLLVSTDIISKMEGGDLPLLPWLVVCPLYYWLLFKLNLFLAGFIAKRVQ